MNLKIMLFAICLISIIANSNASLIDPIVIWHGIDSDASDVQTVGVMEIAIRQAVPGAFIHAIRTPSYGSDLVGSVLGDALTQVQTVCKELSKMSQLKSGFNAVGFDQGGLFLRALQQTCGGIEIKNLITLASPHRGISSVPDCPANQPSFVCSITTAAVNAGAYSSLGQSTVLFLQYFHDSKNEQSYRKDCKFLPEMNNLNTINPSYKQRLQKLENFVMVEWIDDQSTFVPTISEQFGFETSLKNSSLYKDDLLGLKEMDNAGKLHFLTHSGDYPHLSVNWITVNLGPFLWQGAHVPTPFPTGAPTPHHSGVPTPKPSAAPTPSPSPPHTVAPTPHHSVAPTPHQTVAPTPHHSVAPTPHHSAAPTPKHSVAPTPKHSSAPTPRPTSVPTPRPHVPTPFPSPPAPPAGCPQTAAAWQHVNASSVVHVKPECFADLPKASVAALSRAPLCAVLAVSQFERVNSGCAGFTGACIAALNGTLSHALASCVRDLDGDALAGVSAAQVRALSPSFVASIAAAHPQDIARLSDSAVAALTHAQFDAFGNDVVLFLTASQTSKLSADVCSNMPARKETFVSSTACSGLSISCIAMFKSFAGLTGDCVSQLKEEAVSNATAAQIASLSRAGFSGVPLASLRVWMREQPGVLAQLPAYKVALVSLSDVHKTIEVVNATQAVLDACHSNSTFAQLSWIDVALLSTDSIHQCVEGEQIASLSTRAFAGWRAPQLLAIEPGAFRNVSADQLASLSPATAARIDVAQVQQIPPSSFTGLCHDLDKLSKSTDAGVSLKQLEALVASQCDLSKHCEFLNAAHAEEWRNKSSGLANAVSSCNQSKGWSTTDTIVVAVAVGLVALCIIACCIAVVRRRRADRSLGRYEALIQTD